MAGTNYSNRAYQGLAFLAACAGCLYLCSRISDFSRFYVFVLGRNTEVGYAARVFPFAIFFIEILFVLDHLLFTVTQWKYRLIQRSELTPNAPAFVTLLVPTFDEPLSVVARTMQAAVAMRYPMDKFEILLLDDGNDPLKFEFFSLLKESNPTLSLRYLSRAAMGLSRQGYKAANLNYGILNANSATEAFLILDCDHVPLPGILADLVPYYSLAPTAPMKEEVRATSAHGNGAFGFVQSPQTFESGQIDWWDRPCREFHFFTQAYRAYHDAVMLTGTGALISRQALLDVGGFDESTVTEDILTGAKIQAAGYATYFHHLPVANGLIPESLGAILDQRIRWAQGSFQFILKASPLLLKLGPRKVLTYISGVSHFIMPLPYAILAVISPLSLLCGLDSSIHYTNQSMLLLAAFVIFRFLARDFYAKKESTEKTANCYLNILYAPVYLFALTSVFFKKTIVFQTTPKASAGKSLDVRSILYSAFPFMIAVSNLLSVVWVITLGIISSYPLTDFVVDYAGLILLSIYFFLCGTAFLTVLEKRKTVTCGR